MSQPKEKRDPEMDFTIRGNFKKQAAYDIMCSIVECNSSGYWSEIRQVARDDKLNITSFQMKVLTDDEVDDPAPWKFITPAVIVRAMEKIAREGADVGPDSRKEVLLALVTGETGDVDRNVADCIAQVAVVGFLNFG